MKQKMEQNETKLNFSLVFCLKVLESGYCPLAYFQRGILAIFVTFGCFSIYKGLNFILLQLIKAELKENEKQSDKNVSD